MQQAFLTLLQARANVKSNKDSVARLESQYKVAQAYYDVGLKPRLDVLQAESDYLATAEQALLKAESRRVGPDNAAEFPAQFAAQPADRPVVRRLTYLPFTMNIEDCLNTAYKQVLN